MNLESTSFPAEWEPHRAVWLAWPSHQELWGDALPRVQEEFRDLCRAIGGRGDGDGLPEPEPLRVLVPDASREAEARAALEGLDAAFFRSPFGDIWLRDTGPIFLRGPGEALRAACFQFNGWGGKYRLPHDDTVSRRVAAFEEADEIVINDWILEGGAVETDGAGTLLTTEQCLLNPNRNPHAPDRADLEARLRQALGARAVLWLGEGLAADHTDGHVDNLARFVGPGRVVCMEPFGRDDPNREVLEATARALAGMTDGSGRALEVLRVPSPGRVLAADGSLMAASHVNFFIGNRRVVVPVYPDSAVDAVLDVLRPCFPGREVVARPAWHLLHGGGAFHCITQQVPMGAGGG